MTLAAPLEDRIRAAEGRAKRLRTGARLAMVAGLSLVGIVIAVTYPDPGGRNLFSDYVMLPPPLDAWLVGHGAPIWQTPPSLALDNGAWTVRRLGLGIPIAIFAFMLIGKLVPWLAARILLFILSPFWLCVLLQAVPHERWALIYAAADGIVVDHPGAPLVDTHITNIPPATPYVLDPRALPPLLADEARFALAQQAYLDDRPDRAARHLRGLTGVWSPPEEAARVRLGNLARWTAAHGADAGPWARSFIGETPVAWARNLLAAAVGLLAALLCAGGIVTDLTGRRRARRAASLGARALATPAEGARGRDGARFARTAAPGAEPA
jgi:hypothetical protein